VIATSAATRGQRGALRLDDTVYAEDILNELTGEKFIGAEHGDKGLQNKGCYFHLSRTGKGIDNPITTYKRFRAAGATLVYINQTNPPSEFLDVGTLTPPVSLLKKTLAAKLGKEQMAMILPALGGLSIQDAVTVIAVTSARKKDLTVEDVISTRRELIRTSQGLTLIDPYLPAYVPDPALEAFVHKEKKWFLSNSDSRLRPRGLLFDGPPGTGKTLGAKYIASSWGVPLFRLAATFQNKYVGQSEGNATTALKRIEAAEPCVFLIDAVGVGRTIRVAPTRVSGWVGRARAATEATMRRLNDVSTIAGRILSSTRSQRRNRSSQTRQSCGLLGHRR
jgi:hypothetical protein